MFSLTESCTFNGVNPKSYLEEVLIIIKDGKIRDKVTLYYIIMKLKTKSMLSIDVRTPSKSRGIDFVGE